MCSRDFNKEQIGNMSMDTFSKIFEGKHIPYSIKLNWRGEPFLHDKIPRMVEYAKNKGVLDVSLNTNGLLLDGELLYQLSKSDLTWLIFSVDGATKETYEKIRCGGDFNRLLRNIKLAHKLFHRILETQRTKIRIQICKQPANQHEIEDWKRLFKPYADELRIGHLYDLMGRKGYDITQPESCTSFWQRLVISWNGDILPCCADFQGWWKLGNINDTSIYDAWHSMRLNYFRKCLIKGGRKTVALCKYCTSYC